MKLGRKHKDCRVCNCHPLFDLDELVYVHGEYYSKETLLMFKEKAEKCTREHQIYETRDAPYKKRPILLEQENKKLKDSSKALQKTIHENMKEIADKTHEIQELKELLATKEIKQ